MKFHSILHPLPLLFGWSCLFVPLWAGTATLRLSDGSVLSYATSTVLVSAAGDNDSYLVQSGKTIALGRSFGAVGSFRFTSGQNVLASLSSTAYPQGCYKSFTFLLPGEAISSEGSATLSEISPYDNSGSQLPTAKACLAWCQSLGTNFSATLGLISPGKTVSPLTPSISVLLGNADATILHTLPNGQYCDPPSNGTNWTAPNRTSAYFWTATVNFGFHITQGDPMRSLYFHDVPSAIPAGTVPWNTVDGAGLTLIVWNPGTNTVELINGSSSPGIIVGLYTPPAGWQGDIAFIDDTGQGPNSSDGWSYTLSIGSGVVSNQVPPTGTISSPTTVRAGSEVPVAFQILTGN